jgi:hypothetical protein
MANEYGVPEFAGRFGGTVMLIVAAPPGLSGPEAVHKKSDRLTAIPCVPMIAGKSLQPSVIALLKLPVAAEVTL